MELKLITCKTCGSPIDFNPNSKKQTCGSCNNSFILKEPPEIHNTTININEFNGKQIHGDFSSQTFDSYELFEIHEEIQKLLKNIKKISYIDKEQTQNAKMQAIETILELRKKLFKI
jgi:small-conductance mechanosensitive channel